MLDTGIVSDVINNPFGSVVERLATLEDQEIGLSVVVEAERRLGHFLKPSSKRPPRIEGVFARFRVVPFDGGAAVEYGRLRASFPRSGAPKAPTISSSPHTRSRSTPRS